MCSVQKMLCKHMPSILLTSHEYCKAMFVARRTARSYPTESVDLPPRVSQPKCFARFNPTQ